MPTVREPDGLALSSRNARLTPEERAVAPAIYRALRAAAAHINAGETSAEQVRSNAAAGDGELAPETLVEIDRVTPGRA